MPDKERRRKGRRRVAGDGRDIAQGTLPTPERGRTGEAAGAGEDRKLEDPRALALRDRGETAIKSFLTFVFAAPLLLAFAEFLRSTQHEWPNHFGALADPMEKVLSLVDPKPVFALQALTLLLRSSAFLTNKWARNELLFDAFDALYAVTFSLLGFLVGAGVYLAIFRLEVALLLEALALVVLSSLVPRPCRTENDSIPSKRVLSPDARCFLFSLRSRGSADE